MTDFQKKLKKLYGAVPDEVRQRIADGIEKNRKRSAELHFSSPDGKPENIVHFECDLEQHDFLFGFGLFPLCELHGEQLKNWQDICCKLFNLGITPLVWGEYEPARGVERYSTGSVYRFRRPATDDALAFCREFGMKLKAHALMTHLSIPSYLPEEKAAMQRETALHYSRLAERYDGIIDIFDGVNEPLSHAKLRQSLPAFFNDDDYEEWNYREISKYFKKSSLFINENFHPECFQGTASGYYKLLQKLLAVPEIRIDGIGFYYHIFNTEEDLTERFDEFLNPASLLDRFDCYAVFGKEIQLSELSVPVLHGDEESQCLMAEEIYRTAFSHPAVHSITWWNTIAGMVQQGEEGLDSGFLRHDLSERPACAMLKKLINGEWHTVVSAENCGDNFSFRGFCGRYRYRAITAEQKVHSGTFDLIADGTQQLRF